MSDKTKSFEFIQTRLRSANEIFRKGGHVTRVYSDRNFRMHYDNRRIVLVPEELEDGIDMSNVILKTKPADNVNTVKNLRELKRVGVEKMGVGIGGIVKRNLLRYENYDDLVIRNFVKGLLESRFDGVKFKNYNEVVDFVKGYRQDFRISKQSISNLKNRGFIFKNVPNRAETLEFVKFIQSKFPHFKTE